MKEKIKSKLLDAFATFIGSMLALFFSNKVMANIQVFFNNLEISEGTQAKLSTAILALFVAIGYISVLIIFNILLKFIIYFSRPIIKISFTNEQKKSILHLDLTNDEAEYLNIRVNSKFNRFQLWVIRKLLRAKLVISVSPMMCSVELADGYIANDDVYRIDKRSGSIYCDILSKYSPSKNYIAINVELNILRVLNSDGEFTFKLDISECKASKLMFLEYYCKFEIEKFTI